MCDPWKLLASTGVITGSAYHFWDKYINVERKEEEKLVVVSKVCTKESCPCVEDDCKKKTTEENAEIIETDGDLRKRCEEFRENAKKRRLKAREEMKRKIKEGQEKSEEEKMKKLGYKPKKKKETAELSNNQGNGVKEDGKDKGPGKSEKEDSKGKAGPKDKKAKEASKG